METQQGPYSISIDASNHKVERQHDEDRLRHVAGEVRVAHLPFCGGVDPIHVPLRQRLKRVVWAAVDVLLK